MESVCFVSLAQEGIALITPFAQMSCEAAGDDAPFEHFVLHAKAMPDSGAAADVRPVLEALAAEQAAWRSANSAPSVNPLAGLYEAAEALAELVELAAASDGDAEDTLGAWCAADGTFIGSGSIETCGNGAHGYHPPVA